MYELVRKGILPVAAALTLSISASGPVSAATAQDIFTALAAPTGTAKGAGPIYSFKQIVEDKDVRGQMPAINLSDVKFKSGSAEITEEGLAELAKVAAALRTILASRPFEIFLIEGHTDAPGSKKFNMELSSRRAATAMAVLVGRFGVPVNSLAVAGYGESQLLIDTSRAEEENRRITIRRITDLLDPIK
ncbi:MAG: OmpA family protein [Hyphomicrobiales bacterium]|nr:OmpA family protein [Hyphomicrobiales bacterium]